MAYVDKTLQCVDCGINFTFSAQDQEFFAQKGYTNEPKRCSACRDARKAERGGGAGFGGGAHRQMYPVTCAQCGQSTQVPFEPRTGKPVFCSDCYRSTKR